MCKHSVRLFTVLATLVLLITISGTCRAEYKKIKIAVLDFQVEGTFNEAGIGKIAAEWLTTGLVETGRFDVIERRLIKKIVEEQKFGSSGLIDSSSAVRLGRVLGVGTVVAGTVMKLDDYVEINARLLNVETGSIIAAEKIKSGKTRELSDLVSQITDKIIQAFPLQGYIVKRSGDRVTIDIGRIAGARNGARFIVYKEGNVIKHPKTGEVLDIETIDLGEVEVRELKDRTSVAVITREGIANVIQTGHLVRNAGRGETFGASGRVEDSDTSGGEKNWWRRNWDKVKSTIKEMKPGESPGEQKPEQGVTK
jgi:TolB-like protein